MSSEEVRVEHLRASSAADAVDAVDDQGDESFLAPGAATSRDRLDELEGQLDQCWDLLRQRRARRGSVQDAAAEVRSVETVRGYLQ